jgi:hypothetical protein
VVHAPDEEKRRKQDAGGETQNTLRSSTNALFTRELKKSPSASRHLDGVTS